MIQSALTPGEMFSELGIFLFLTPKWNYYWKIIAHTKNVCLVNSRNLSSELPNLYFVQCENIHKAKFGCPRSGAHTTADFEKLKNKVLI